MAMLRVLNVHLKQMMENQKLYKRMVDQSAPILPMGKLSLPREAPFSALTLALRPVVIRTPPTWATASISLMNEASSVTDGDYTSMKIIEGFCVGQDGETRGAVETWKDSKLAKSLPSFT